MTSSMPSEKLTFSILSQRIANLVRIDALIQVVQRPSSCICT
jgi:hypothetical protein